MAPSSPAPLTPFVPHQAHIALAIAIIRSKPPNVTIRDYILQLRSQLRHGELAISKQGNSRYIDLVAYWQDQYQRAQDECDRLRVINTKLERSNRLLSNLANVPSDASIETASVTSKRKAPSVSIIRPSKRSKAIFQAPGEQSTAGIQETIDNDFEFLDNLGENGGKLTEALYTTHRHCRATVLDTDALCFSLVQTASALGRVIRFAAHNYESLSRQGRRTTESIPLHQDKSDFALALTVCARGFLSVLVGINKIEASVENSRLPSLVVCELVEMFKTSLNAIAESARHTAHRISSEPPQAKKNKVKPLVVTVKESASARALAHFLISLLGHLDKADFTHQRIFDGFVYILFERVGKQLYYCTFGRHRSDNMEENIVLMTESQPTPDNAKRDTISLAVRFEVKALILILERAMGLAPNHMNPQAVKATKTNQLNRTMSMKTLPTASKARLSPMVKERLQRTLISCMFGETAHDEFLDTLTKPIPTIRLSTSQNMTKIEDKDIEEWYKKEVWRLVGWDILAKDAGW